MAVRAKELTLSDAHLVMIRLKNTTYNFYGQVKDFRQHDQAQGTQSAFATNAKSNNASFRG